MSNMIEMTVYRNGVPQTLEFDEDGPACLELVIDEALAIIDAGVQDSPDDLQRLIDVLERLKSDN